MGKHKGIHMITFILLAVGGLNWGIFAITGWEIGSIFGGMDETISKIIYILVGLSAVYEIACHGKTCKLCKPDGSMPQQSGM
ncbi:MAG: hypothetical protein A2751_02690 [Candidatus Doudnabacteria bacterium RIFCSPHIGHO2_01_FULL_46_14]|uniref:DUF378 domain-containing protein n=1 Tax=Candidatus Doudnabacteria bacterium RIFCSPHIGHO2_01_FULL_46_14 TaxID=1817824 RepID=A0A1F5NK13_9BACT|nr:MAG: hypothetical protein A2751_02690 [Candidatus Doudnabacteria bacterium RIFCSPHIGHO2_01_FULL_46_14]